VIDHQNVSHLPKNGQSVGVPSEIITSAATRRVSAEAADERDDTIAPPEKWPGVAE
jgi:hypothetical protein